MSLFAGDEVLAALFAANRIPHTFTRRGDLAAVGVRRPRRRLEQADRHWRDDREAERQRSGSTRTRDRGTAAAPGGRDHRQVHNLTVDDLHTYHVVAGVTSVLVHNCNTTVYREELRWICYLSGARTHSRSVAGSI
ncbi:hypothetical protein AB8O38_20305 [Saccharomonospora xinjiangensis]|uniref:hypothetical protein n=1 Tax=Saccharomonospora xinjiangensis TaxID=75294 RepID=UPI00350E9B16